MNRHMTWLPLVALMGCADRADTGAQDDTGTALSGALPDSYDFDSAFAEGSSVSYSGQVLRQLLIDDMKTHLGGVTDRINSGAFYPVAGEVEDELRFYFEFDSDTSGSIPHLTATELPALQLTYDDVSSGKNLVEKLAGNDETGQHKDWSVDFVGWDADEVSTPESLVRLWLSQIDAQSVAWVSGDIPLDPSGALVPAVYVTPAGQDLRQLLEKFLRGAVAFSQGADDYLDDDIAGKGLLSDHTAAEEGKPYTALEHAWDEGFGYFGAAATYPQWTDDEIADVGNMDVDGDGYVDLLRELNWGHSVNAAKRDRDSVAATDFTADAWAGFAAGRLLLSETAGQELSADQLATLQAHRDTALTAWEAALASTAVHYINEVLVDMAAIGTDDYSFADHAKHWSELKGFALAFQFSPRSPLSDDDFATLHGLLGTAPVLADADEAQRTAGAADLLAARELLGEAYGFDMDNLGDDNGEGGW